MGSCDNTFFVSLKLLPLLQQSEGNTLAATEFIRLVSRGFGIYYSKTI